MPSSKKKKKSRSRDKRRKTTSSHEFGDERSHSTLVDSHKSKKKKKKKSKSKHRHHKSDSRSNDTEKNDRRHVREETDKKAEAKADLDKNESTPDIPYLTTARDRATTLNTSDKKSKPEMGSPDDDIQYLGTVQRSTTSSNASDQKGECPCTSGGTRRSRDPKAHGQCQSSSKSTNQKNERSKVSNASTIPNIFKSPDRVNTSDLSRASAQVEAAPSLKDKNEVKRKKVYEDACAWENEVAKNLNVDTHLQQNLETCTKLERLLDDIYDLKEAGKTKTTEFMTKRMDVLMEFTKLRRMNRYSKLRLDMEKTDMKQMQVAVHLDRLLLHDLLFEAVHWTNQASIAQGKAAKEKEKPIPDDHSKSKLDQPKPELPLVKKISKTNVTDKKQETKKSSSTATKNLQIINKKNDNQISQCNDSTNNKART